MLQNGRPSLFLIQDEQNVLHDFYDRFAKKELRGKTDEPECDHEQSEKEKYRADLRLHISRRLGAEQPDVISGIAGALER